MFARGGEREAGQGGPQAEVEIEEIDIEDSEEGGVSSIVSSSGEQVTVVYHWSILVT